MDLDQLALDERIERLRRRVPADRRPAKGDLIEAAGVSRSRWYRIMAGDSHFTIPELNRLAQRLETTVGQLVAEATAAQWEPAPDSAAEPDDRRGDELQGFVNNFDRIVRTLSNGTSGLGPDSKLALLNGIEHAARLAGEKLPDEFWELRKAVTEGRL